MTELTTAGRVIELVRRMAGPGAEAEAGVYHAAEALTRFANSAIHQNVADATTVVRLRLHLDGRTATGATTITGAAGLESLVERTIAAARLSPPDPHWAGLTPPAPVAARDIDEATARSAPEERAARVRDFVQAAGGLETAGFCRTVYASGAFANSAGQAVEGRAVEASMDGIARHAAGGATGGAFGPDHPGRADGVARLAGDRLADIDGGLLGARAAAKARAGERPVELPPGRYEVVLEPEAVADVLHNLAAFGFNGRSFAQRQSFAELGAQQFDAAVTISDEPRPALPFDTEGTPRGPLTLVDAGTTVAVTHDRSSAAEAGTASTGHASPASRSWGPTATHMSLAPSGVPAAGADTDTATGPGPTAESARPLVARVRRGLLITDFWYTRVLDQKSLVITGLTRNGVWLIENGEITTAVGNMRFTQSYPQALGPGAVLGVGATSVRLPDRWSGVQYATPALHLASWHLSGNASG
jgi:predicted Zn-dependent protease